MHCPPPHPRVARSMALWQRAVQRIPGGTQLISRRPTRFAYGASPVYAVRARGARFWDVDGNEYLDWTSGIRSILLGYADPAVDEAVCRQLADGVLFGVSHPLEIELADALAETVPCAEMSRFTKTGGEACAVAVRIARAATGRDTILFCGYHGWHDWYLAANLSRQSNLDPHLFPGIEPAGVPRGLEGTAVPFPYGDLEALQRSLDAHRGQVAAVMLEPMRSDWPPEGYLAGVAELAKQHGAVLIFDEVSAGLRTAPGGVQEASGVVPDLAVLAKSLANGYPLGAVVGRRDVMQVAGRLFISSTNWSETLGLRAALTTLHEARRRGVPGLLQQRGEQLMQGLNAAAQSAGAPVECRGLAATPYLHFELSDADLRTQAATLFIQEMALRGFHGSTSFCVNAAQTEDDIRHTCQAAGEVFAMLAEALRDHRVDQLLRCPPQEDSFRRLVL